MDSKLNRLRENYGRRTTANLQFPETKPVQNRKMSQGIKDRIRVYEDQVEESEKNRMNQYILAAKKKYNITKGDISKMSSTNFEGFMNEIEQIVNNYEKELELYKIKNECEQCKLYKDRENEIMNELRDKTNIIDKLHNEKDNISITMNELRDKTNIIDKLQNEKDNISIIMNKLEHELKNLKEYDLPMMNNEIMEKETKISLQEEKIQELQSLLNDKSEIEKQLYSKEEKINELELKLLAIDDKENKIKKQEDKINELQNKLIRLEDEMNNKLANKDNEINKLRSSIESNKQPIRSNNFPDNRIKKLEDELFYFKKNEIHLNQVIEDLEKEKQELITKYNDLNIHIGVMIDDITKLDYNLARGDSNVDYLLQKSFNDNNWFVELLADNLFSEYKLDRSITLTSLNKRLLTNYNQYLNTIFNKEGNLLSISLVHEYLQDIFLNRDQWHLDNIDMIKLTEYKLNKYNYNVKNEDLLNKDYSDVADIILNNNPVLLLSEKSLNFDEKISKLVKKYNILQNPDEIKKQIRNKLNQNIKTYNETVQKEIKKIIEVSVQFINASKIINRFYEIFDFSKLFHSHNSIIKDDNSIIYYQSIDAPTNIENLLLLMKYSKSVENLRIQGHLEIGSLFKFPLSDILKKFIFIKNAKSLAINDTTNLSDTDILCMQKTIELSGIQTLNIANNYMGDECIRKLTEAMKFNNSIKSLDVSFNKITHKGGCYIAEMLTKNNTLMKIVLSGNNIIGHGIHSLVKILLEGNKTLIHLDLSLNGLKLDDILYISNMVTKNNNIQILNLSNNFFEFKAANNLGMSLKENKNLKKLYLNYIGLEEDSAPYLLMHLSESHIEELYLDGNNLGQNGGILFANIIKSHKYLNRLSLKSCRLNSASLECISLALEHTTRYKLIELNDNEFSDDSVMMLYDSLRNIDTRIGITVKGGNVRTTISNCKNFIL